MDLNLILPSNASGDIFPGNTLTAYRVMLQKYANLEVPHEGTLLSLTMPTRWSNIKRSEIYLVQVEKAAARPTYVRVHKRGGVSGGDVDDDKRSRRSPSGLRRGAKISKLRRLIETAARRRAGGERGKRKGVTLPQVSHHAPIVITRKSPKRIDGTSALDNILKEEAEIEVEVEEAKAGLGLTAADAADSDDDDDETVYYSIKDDGVGSSSSSKPIPPALTHIEKIAKKIFRGERSYTQVVLEAGRVETNRELVHQLNQLVVKKLPHLQEKLREERRRACERGPEDVFSFNTFNQKTAISLPHDYMLVIPEDLSLQLGLRGKVYLGRRTKPEDMTDVNYRNHTVYVYTDIIKNVVVGNTEAPLLRCTGVKNNSEEAMMTYDFPNPVYVPLNTNYFKEVTIYLRDSFGDPIPFQYVGSGGSTRSPTHPTWPKRHSSVINTRFQDG